MSDKSELLRSVEELHSKVDMLAADMALAARPIALRQGMPVAAHEFEAWAHVRGGRVLGISVGYVRDDRIKEGDFIVPLRLTPFGDVEQQAEFERQKEAYADRRTLALKQFDEINRAFARKSA